MTITKRTGRIGRTLGEWVNLGTKPDQILFAPAPNIRVTRELQGLCIRCGSPEVAPGTKCCASCNEKNNVTTRNNYLKNKVAKKCVMCGKQSDTNNKNAYCKDCIQKRNEISE